VDLEIDLNRQVDQELVLRQKAEGVAEAVAVVEVIILMRAAITAGKKVATIVKRKKVPIRNESSPRAKTTRYNNNNINPIRLPIQICFSKNFFHSNSYTEPASYSCTIQ
jgi:hypothetical protein